MFVRYRYHVKSLLFLNIWIQWGWIGQVNPERVEVANHPTPAAVSLPKNAALGVNSRAANAVVLVVGIK